MLNINYVIKTDNVITIIFMVHHIYIYMCMHARMHARMHTHTHAYTQHF